MTQTTHKRETFSGRRAFIFAAIGSAVGLGNIWRFPYVTYENGGGAFIIPYIVALLTAGIPLLFLDYALGHKFRASPPLAYRKLKTMFETFGWLFSVGRQVILIILSALHGGVTRSISSYMNTSKWLVRLL